MSHSNVHAGRLFYIMCDDTTDFFQCLNFVRLAELETLETHNKARHFVQMVAGNPKYFSTHPFQHLIQL